MDERHECAEVFSIREYARTQRQQHQEILLEQHRQGKIILPPEKIAMTQSGDSDISASGDGDDDDDVSDLDIAVDDYYFLQPVPTRQRRMMLRQAGIKKIDNVEKDECKDIRVSREVCGCDCRIYCDPATCLCSLAGIKCQVDRMSFPCGCTKEGCGNTSGRVEFNPMRVRTHFLHTLMRLDFDEKKEREAPACRVNRQAKHIRFDNDGAAGDEVGKDDMSQYNSTELGSCRDCQNTDVTKVMMHETQLNAAACMMAPQSSAAYSAMLGNSQGASGMNQSCLQPSMLCGNGISGEGTDDDDGSTPGYQCGPDDDDAGDESSYSESSDCSSGDESTNNESGCTDYHNLTPTTCFDQQQNFDLAPHTNYDAEVGNDYKELGAPMTPTSSASGSPGYKLEPISEILNPLRYGAYEGGQSWGSDSYYDEALSGRAALAGYEDSEACSTNLGAGLKCPLEGQVGTSQTSNMADEFAQSSFESDICSSTQRGDDVTPPCYHELTLSTHQLSNYMSSSSACLTATECTVTTTASSDVEDSHKVLGCVTETSMMEDIPTSSSQDMLCQGPDLLVVDITSGDMVIRSEAKTDITNQVSQHDMSVSDACVMIPNTESGDMMMKDIANAVSPNDMCRVGMNVTFEVENGVTVEVSQNDAPMSDACVSMNAESTNGMTLAGPSDLASVFEAASTNDVSESVELVGVAALNDDDDRAVSSSVGVVGKDIESESSSNSYSASSVSDDQGVDATQADVQEQNFGQMIKESMVETVSA